MCGAGPLLLAHGIRLIRCSTRGISVRLQWMIRIPGTLFLRSRILVTSVVN